MRYEPYEDEYKAVPLLNKQQLIEYFLLRIYETEEVWGLKEKASEWMTYEFNGQLRLPIFAYKRYADDATTGDWEVMIPIAESMEFFMERTLPRLHEKNVCLEIMPREQGTGHIVTAQQLLNILEGMIDSGEYTMEG